MQPAEASKVSGRSRTKSSNERRDDLMNAAEELFLKQGVGPTTIQQITSGAGIAKGTFYLHFASKDDVVLALRNRFVREFVLRTEQTVQSRDAKDWRAKLATWVMAVIEGYLDSLPLHDVVFHQASPHSWHDTSTDLLIDHFRAVLEAGARDSAWDIEEARFTAVVLFSGLHAIVDNVLDSGVAIDRHRLGTQLQNICFRAVKLRQAE